MATVLNGKMHAYDAAKQEGRVPYKVADLSLAEWGRKELRLAEATAARVDGVGRCARKAAPAGRVAIAEAEAGLAIPHRRGAPAGPA